MDLDNIGPDENNGCRLIFDENLEVDIEKSTEEDSFWMHAVVSRISLENKASFYETLLEANLFGMGTGNAYFGLDLNREEILLFTKISLKNLDYHTFEKNIEEFVNRLEYWKDKLENGELLNRETIEGIDLMNTRGIIKA